jgi:hypothetical protein
VKRIYCTFSGSAYDPTTERIVKDAPGFGVDEVRVYDDLWLMGTDFYRMNYWLWEMPKDPAKQRRGFGWYCWKPYVILEEMERLERRGYGGKGQHPATVLFTDADTYPVADLTVLFDRCRTDDGMMFFRAEGWFQRGWCKRDAMIVMGCDNDRYLDAPHTTARFMLFECGNWRAKQFLIEWLAYMVHPLTCTLEPSVLAPEHEGFQEHRSDQAIMSNLVHKYGCKLYREADEYGETTDRDRELYPMLFKQVYKSGIDSLNGSKYRNVT